MLVALALTHITIAAVTIFLHRSQAHRALDLHPVASHFFRFWLWLTTGMVTKEWVAIHRKHHAKCETPDDPHSPQMLGINSVFWGGVVPVSCRKPQVAETLERYGHGTPDDWLERNVYSRHRLGIWLMMAINLVLFGPCGLPIWAVQMVWIPFWAAGIINGVGHYWGYRNFACDDASTNIVPWGILIGGEELHNNHHAYGTSARLSNKWYEFDIGWLYIRLLDMLGLATVKKVAPRRDSGGRPDACDLDTLQAVITHRYDVMAQYVQVAAADLRARKRASCKASLRCRSRSSRFRRWLARDAEALPTRTGGVWRPAGKEQRLTLLVECGRSLPPSGALHRDARAAAGRTCRTGVSVPRRAASRR